MLAKFLTHGLPIFFFAFGVAAQPPLRIGVMASLTGDYASAGDEIRRGITLATEQLKGRGVPVEVALEDACLPQQGVSSLKKLVDQNKIDALVSNYCLISLNAVLPIINQHKLLTFHNSIVPKNLIGASSFVYSTWPTIEEEVQAIVSSQSDEALTRSAVLYLESPWGITYAEALRAQLKNRGMKVVFDESEGFGVHDFRSEISKLKALNPTFIFVAHTGSNLVSFLKQLRAAGIPGDRVFVPSDADDVAIAAALGEAGKGVRLFSSQSAKEEESVAAFDKAFQQAFQKKPDPLGRHAYDQLMIAAKILGVCGKDSECITKEMKDLGTYRGATGEFSIVAERSAKRSFAPKSMVGGSWVYAD